MKDIDAKLVIVGKGPLETVLKEQAAIQKEKILFLGAKTHEELKVIYASADIFVAPSVTAKDGDQEGFGLVLIEAMASGLPVIASRSGGITDIISDGENGLLCEEKNAVQIAAKISILLDNDDLRKKIINNAKQTVTRYSYQNIASRYYDIIKQTL